MDTGNINSANFIKNIVSGAASSVEKASDDSFAKKLEAAVRNNDDRELMKACREFESVMLNMMYKQMKATIIRSNLVERDAGAEIFESMLDEHLMEEASKTGSFGLAESMYKQLSGKYGNRTISAVTDSGNEAVKEKLESDFVEETGE